MSTREKERRWFDDGYTLCTRVCTCTNKPKGERERERERRSMREFARRKRDDTRRWRRLHARANRCTSLRARVCVPRVLSHGGEQHAAVSRPGVANHSSFYSPRPLSFDLSIFQFFFSLSISLFFPFFCQSFDVQIVGSPLVVARRFSFSRFHSPCLSRTPFYLVLSL